MTNLISAFVFDLDGIIVDTTHYHYLSWKELARTFDYDFQEPDNERLKGANRTTSLNILLNLAGIDVGEEEKIRLREKKNKIYHDLIRQMTVQDTLPGIISFIESARTAGLSTGLASSSENAIRTIKRLGLSHLFDQMLDATSITTGKPDPLVYLEIARKLGQAPSCCIVFEDAANGIQAAKAAGMPVVGMGQPDQVKDADLIIESFERISPSDILTYFRERRSPTLKEARKPPAKNRT